MRKQPPRDDETPDVFKGWKTNTDRNSLLVAVIRTHEDMANKKLKPGAEEWGINQYQRQIFHTRVVDEWARITGHHRYFFPWTIDHVVLINVKYRKCDDKKKLNLRKSLGMVQ